MTNAKLFIVLRLATPLLLGAVSLCGEDRPDSAGAAAITSSPAPEFSPMTRSERLRNYLLSVTDYESVVRSAASSAISQATGTPKEWGGGAEGFGERLGNSYANHMIQRTLRYGISAALHEDNRYFVSGESGFLKRTRYAIKSTLMARHDNGSQSFSFSRVGGAAGAAFISRAWQPRSTTSAGDGAVVFGTSMGSEIGFNIFREFWPDMKRRFHKE